MPARAPIIVLALAFVGCASKAEEPRRATHHDATAPEEIRLIKLTLFPFWEIPEDENGFGTPVPLDGVKVCVKSKRPYGGAWTDFVETHGPCTTTAAGEKVVLEKVPGLFELLVTAELDGYRSSVFAVTTWQWDQDTTADNTDRRYDSLRRSDAKGARIDPTITVDPALGDLTFFIKAGARVTLDPSPGDGHGPFYFFGGKFVSGAMEALASDGGTVRNYAGGSFVNLTEGEYLVRPGHPNAFCQVHGTSGSNGDPIYGYDRPHGLIGAPVLRGYSTPAIRIDCSCLHDPSNPEDCSPIVDSGSPSFDAEAPTE